MPVIQETSTVSNCQKSQLLSISNSSKLNLNRVTVPSIHTFTGRVGRTVPFDGSETDPTAENLHGIASAQMPRVDDHHHTICSEYGKIRDVHVTGATTLKPNDASFAGEDKQEIEISKFH